MPKFQYSDDKEFWKEASNKYVSAREAARDLNCDPGTILKYLRKFGFSFSQDLKLKRGKKEENPLIVNLPPVNIKEYLTPQIEGDEEIIVLHASDGHAGKQTKSYSGLEFKERMYKLYESTMTITELHRKMYPIRKLHIVNTGDNCQGENPFQGSVIGSVEMGARDQVTKLAVPVWNDVIGSLKQHFDEIIFDGFAGNHGHDKLAPATSSLDLLFYDILRSGIGQQKGITINIHEQFADIVYINNFKFFVFHGDGIPCQQGVPFFALDKKLKSWYIQWGGFNYALGGHFHKRHSDEVASKFEYFMCGTLVSDDEWALNKLGISSNPSQGIFGVHPRKGVTWRYPVVVDDEFLPQSDKKEIKEKE